MNSNFRRLFAPIKIGAVSVPNRIVNTVHYTHLDDDRDTEYLRERARGGAGLIGVQASSGVAQYSIGVPSPHAGDGWDLHPMSPITADGVAFYDNLVIPALRRRADVIRSEGACSYGQVAHSGATEHAVLLRPTIGPSSVPDPYEAQVPHALTEAEIEDVVFAFAHGIRRVKQAGLDAAEIHAAHGHLLAEFLSPYYNRRTDRWGGGVENRGRIITAIIAAAREMVGQDFPIGIRIGFDGNGSSRGVGEDDLLTLVGQLATDVAFFSVSLGNYVGFGDGHEIAYVSPWYTDPGFAADVSARIRGATDVPVIVTGRINDPALAESLLAEGRADMVGMVRSLIADPEWPNKARTGRENEIRMCLGINECHHIGPRRVPMTCAVNASAGRERESRVVLARKAQTIAVVGAGPAGLEAARVAAERGHHVYLCDSARELGGTPRLLARDPNRRNLRDLAAYFEARLPALGVQLLLGNVVEADDLVEFGLDAVIVATGSSPFVPDVSGVGASHVLTWMDALIEPDRISDQVVVVGGIDGHLAAPTVAECLADRGHAVTLISEHVDLAPWVEHGTRVALSARLRRKSVVTQMGRRLAEVFGTGAALVDTFTGRRNVLDDVTIVLACGSVPNDNLARQLEGRIPKVHVVGDALAPRRIMHATIEGARAGRLV